MWDHIIPVHRHVGGCWTYQLDKGIAVLHVEEGNYLYTLDGRLPDRRIGYTD